MGKLFFWSVVFFFFSISLIASDIDIKNTVLKADNNSYQVTLKITGKENPGILKLTLSIPDEYKFDLYNNPNLLIDSRGQTVKFYTNFDADNHIEINCKLTRIQPDNSEASIPIHLQFSVNDEMVVLEKEIILSENELISNEQMDSLTTYLEELSKKFENKDAIALNKVKDLPSNTSENKTISKKEELTAMPEGYNSSTKSGLAASNKLYSVQILSLQFYNENRLNSFLSSYKIKSSETYKKEVNGMIKIYIGKFETYEEAKALKEKLIQRHQLTDSFVVSY
ncbi:MAG: SPOR domain-containing protein [Bacteroidetes bacterium]|nr:SPOR domain-containing protein [Bacteroidota bacterium]